MKPAKPPIYFHFAYSSFHLRNRKSLKSFIFNIFITENKQLKELRYIFCSDDYLLKLNQTFLQHNTYTDVITFPLSQPRAPIISEVYISIDRIKENAATSKTSFIRELHRVIFHGALHLCGYMDKSKSQQKLMRQKEEYYLNQYFVPRGTI